MSNGSRTEQAETGRSQGGWGREDVSWLRLLVGAENAGRERKVCQLLDFTHKNPELHLEGKIMID